MNFNCHEVDYKIIGDDMQLIEIELDPGETVIAEAGAMSYMDDGISFEAKTGDGSNPSQDALGKLMNIGSRMLMGESLFMTHFTNSAHGKKTVSFAGPYPGKIIPVDLAKMPANKIICQKDSFLAAAYGTRISIEFNKKLGAGFFGGEGFIMEKLEGNGLAFIHAGGTIVEKQLNNQSLLVDTGCIVAFSDGIDYDIQRAGGLKSMFFGGEGIFLAKLSGTGTVWLQSMPLARLADRVLQDAQFERTGEGGVLGAVGNLFESN